MKPKRRSQRLAVRGKSGSNAEISITEINKWNKEIRCKRTHEELFSKSGSNAGISITEINKRNKEIRSKGTHEEVKSEVVKTKSNIKRKRNKQKRKHDLILKRFNIPDVIDLCETSFDSQSTNKENPSDGVIVINDEVNESLVDLTADNSVIMIEDGERPSANTSSEAASHFKPYRPLQTSLSGWDQQPNHSGNPFVVRPNKLRTIVIDGSNVAYG